MALIRLNINGKEVTAYEGKTILDVAMENNIYIPTLCFDERVEVFGSCGMCVVEMENNPKLLRACATTVFEGMIILTDTKKVRKARKTALELLLSDHTGDCRPPCVLNCPGDTDCQGYVGLVANGHYKEAVKLIKEKLPFPSSIGRICPHPCETACRRAIVDEPIAIANIKSFMGDVDLSGDTYVPSIAKDTGKEVAIIGGGPAGITAANFLRISGHNVTIYDSMPKMGGMLRYGIPEFRLPKSVLDKEIKLIENLGVTMKNNIRIGKDLTFEYIKNNYSATLVACGAWSSMNMGVKGENLDGVIGGIDFLRKIVLNEPDVMGKNVAIVGGGNTAMDACRTAIRMGAEKVYCIYRRTREEMPAEDIEIKEAEEEGVIFKYLSNPIEFFDNGLGRVKMIKLQKMKLGEVDASGRRSPVPIEGEEEFILADSVIMAIGQKLNPEGLEGIKLSKRGTILADESTFRTNIEGVFAVGDATNKGAGIAIEAIGEAHKVSKVINSYLKGETLGYKKPYVVEDDVTLEDYKDVESLPREKMSHLSPEERRDNFREMNLGYTQEQARKEAMRCLECGCKAYFDCKLLKLANEYDVEPEKFEGEKHINIVDSTHPFIERNPEKCILCGLCVRVCDEVMGRTSLGFVDRGFSTTVMPAMEHSLRDSDCISCGQCINLCPTGALVEKLNIKKTVPLAGEITRSVCSCCSVGCEIEVVTAGNMTIKHMPVDEKNGLLCVRGKFGFTESQKEGRITEPHIRKNGILTPVTWDEAKVFISKKIQRVKSQYGNESMAVSVSDKYTNEDIFVAKKYAHEVLKTPNIFSFNGISSGLREVIGYDGSTNSFDELSSTGLIVLLGTHLMKDHATLGVRIRKAAKNGVKLVVISEEDNLEATDWAHERVYAHNNMKFLKGMIKSLIDMGCEPMNADGFEELKDSLKDVVVTEETMKIAKMYKEAKKAMIVFDEFKVNSDAAKAVAALAVISGHIGSPRDGIIQLKPNCNSQGLSDLGASVSVRKMKNAINKGEIRGLMIFGEDIRNVDLEKLDFLLVQDTIMTETAKWADVVLPGVSLSESKGTVTNSERKMQTVRQTVSPLGYQNWQIIKSIANTDKTVFKFNSEEEIYAHMLESTPVYRKKFENVLCVDNHYYTPNGKAQLKTILDRSLFTPRDNTSVMYARFEEMLARELLF